MAKTIVGLYKDFGTAQQVVRDLENNGFSGENIGLAARDQTGGDLARADAVLHGSKTGGYAASGGLIGALTGAGVPEDDARAYNEGVSRGGSLVTVDSPNDRADQASEIMDRYHPVDIDTLYGEKDMFGKTAEQARDVNMSERTTADEEREGESWQTVGEGETHIPIAEEELRVGKRDVDRGGVRIHSYMTEKPVEETQQVRDETVNVERRAADRPLDKGEMDKAFQEQTYEVTENDEELVVDKNARVVEDVVVRKDVEQHPETVRDTVRRTDVETERFGANAGRSTSRDFDAFAPDFRNHYQTQYATTGRDFNDYQPAYRYGYDLASNPNYRGQDWSQIEPVARRDWERSHQGSRWDDFKDSVRYAWERGTGGAQDSGSYPRDNYS